MTDLRVNGARPRGVPTHSLEYDFYFATVFVVALFVGVQTWTWRLIPQRRLPKNGPIKRALKDAHVIAPIIFRS